MIRPLSKLLGAGGQPNESYRALGLAVIFNDSALGVVRGPPSSGSAKRTAHLRSALRLCMNRLVGALCVYLPRAKRTRPAALGRMSSHSVSSDGVRPSESHHAVISLSGAVRP